MSKDLNTGWVRASRGLAGLQEKLQADTEEGKPQGEFQSCIPEGSQISKTTKCSKSQSSYIGLKRQRKEGSAETSWGGTLSNKLRDQGFSPMCPQRCSTPGVDSDTCRYPPHTEARAGCSKNSRKNRQEQKALLKEEKKNRLSVAELVRNSCQSWTGGCSFHLCSA